MIINFTLNGGLKSSSIWQFWRGRQ